MKKLANIHAFESLQNRANYDMGYSSTFSVFNSDDILEEDEYDEDEDDWEDEEDDEDDQREYAENEDRAKQKELEDRWGIHNYLEVLDKCVGQYVMVNSLADRLFENGTIEQISGDYNAEVMQFLLISESGADWLSYHTNCPVYYDSEHDVYLLGKTSCGMAWEDISVPTLH